MVFCLAVSLLLQIQQVLFALVLVVGIADVEETSEVADIEQRARVRRVKGLDCFSGESEAVELCAAVDLGELIVVEGVKLGKALAGDVLREGFLRSEADGVGSLA